ncbi:MAG: hypothetical protein HXS48_13410 [Theionarchaea archaeon]|nr:hypothetical protein [Theionarchaea archaeon]
MIAELSVIMHKGTMKLSTIMIVCVIFLVGVRLCAVPAGSSGEFQITTNPRSQDDPAIYGDIVVWSDKRNGNWDIYGHNLVTREEFPVTTNPYSQGCPAIYGDIVVWQDKRHGNWDI